MLTFRVRSIFVLGSLLKNVNKLPSSWQEVIVSQDRLEPLSPLIISASSLEQDRQGRDTAFLGWFRKFSGREKTVLLF